MKSKIWYFCTDMALCCYLLCSSYLCQAKVDSIWCSASCQIIRKVLLQTENYLEQHQRKEKHWKLTGHSKLFSLKQHPKFYVLWTCCCCSKLHTVIGDHYNLCWKFFFSGYTSLYIISEKHSQSWWKWIEDGWLYRSDEGLYVTDQLYVEAAVTRLQNTRSLVPPLM